MPEPTRHRPSRRAIATSRSDVIIVVVGFLLSAAASVMAYRAVGPYGDGPINVGLWRTQDPETGAQLVYRDVPQPDGTVLRYLFSDGSRALKQIQVRRVVDGEVKTVGVHMDSTGVARLDAGGRSVVRDGSSGGVKVGFSLRGNGVIDAWEFRDAKGQLTKIEVSRRQDGNVDRWEYYENDQLARVEEDENRDGKPDRWLTYEAGILVEETRNRGRD